MLNKIFEKLDESVFTPDVKKSLEESFNEAVEQKALVIADEKIQESINEKIAELDEKGDEYIDFLDEKFDGFKEELSEKVMQTLDSYLEGVVADFVSENSDNFDNDIKVRHSEMVLEAFDATIKAGAVDIAEIHGLCNENNDKIDSNKTDKINRLMAENIELKEQKTEIIKLGLLNELSEGLSVMEAEKLERLSETIDDRSEPDDYFQKLQTLKENVIGSYNAKTELTESRTTNERRNYRSNDNLVVYEIPSHLL